MAPYTLRSLVIISYMCWAHGARTRRGNYGALFDDSSMVQSGEPPVLCDTKVVEEACLILNGGEKHARGDDWTNSEALRSLLSSTEGAMSKFWEAVNLPTAHEMSDSLGFWVDCPTLCSSVVDYGRQHGVMPATSDVACYNVGMETRCDLPMGPALFPTFGPKPGEDIPDFHDEEVMHNVRNKIQSYDGLNSTGSLVSIAQELSAEEVDYDTWEMSERIANIFRIYPTKKPQPEDSDGGSSLAETSAWPAGGETLNAQKISEAKGYMSHVIRAINMRATRDQMSKWFGSTAFHSETTRKEIKRVLNSVDHMISNVYSVYPGSQCSPNTYAYVYPEAATCSRRELMRDSACTKYDGKYVFYLCPLYLKRPEEMIETLVHEGSHHATAFTDDVKFEGGTAYGRGTCERLAKRNPRGAIKNADNFCYYIQDVATQVNLAESGSSGGTSSGSSTGSSSGSSGGSSSVSSGASTGSASGEPAGGSSGGSMSGSSGGTSGGSSGGSSSGLSGGSSGSSSGASSGSSSGGKAPAPQPISMKCFDGSINSHGDEYGDCKCPPDYTCYKGSAAGCPYSGSPPGPLGLIYGSASCKTCTCRKSKQDTWL